MAFKFIATNIQELLTNLGYTNIITDQIVEDTSKDTSLQSAIFILSEPSVPTLSSVQSEELSIYIRRPSIDEVVTDSRNIYHYLHGGRSNVGIVANNYFKINLIQCINTPYLFSSVANGGKSIEFLIRIKVDYIDNTFDKY